MAKSVKVFVTYSRHENEVERVSAICKWFKLLSGDKLEFVLDSNLSKSQDVHEFERSLSTYRACIVMGTRKYREKVISGEYGVSREFSVLLEAMKSKSIRVFPVITEAEFEAVFPDDLKGPLATNLSGISHNPAYHEVSNHSISQFQSEARKLVGDIISAVSELPKDNSNLEKIRQKLIFEQKHELMSGNVDDKTLKEIFVKTSYFTAVKRKSSYLLIGRKGSGKSFLTDYFLRFPDNLLTVNVLLHLRHFRLMTLYTMGSRARLKNDLNTIISQSDVFECAWGVIFTVGCLAQTYLDILSGRIEGELNEFSAIRTFLEDAELIDRDFNGDGPSLSVQRLIDWSTEKVHHIIEAGIDSLQGEYAQSISSIQSLVDSRKVIPAIVGISAINEFSAIIQKKRPSFFIAIDGFDSKFDTFRRETNVLAFTPDAQSERVQFEIDWLRGLVESSFDLISPASGAGIGFREAAYNLLVTLPRDRFIEIQRLDRDGFRLRHKHVDIEWSGLELMNLVRKRLEYYYNTKSTKDDIFDKLDESITWIGSIPKDLKFKYNEHDVSIGIFEYILRHSFWRPRDIIYHVSLLIDRGERNKKILRKITVENVREIVMMASTEIIEKEFIGEFISIMPDIANVIEKFHQCKNILQYSEIYEIISGCEFRLSSGDIIQNDIQKLDFLYEIGFIGVYHNEVNRRKFGFLRKESFSFSDPIDFYRRLRENDKHRLSWVIHPIFTEFLDLNTDNSDFTLNYERKYLIDRD